METTQQNFQQVNIDIPVTLKDYPYDERLSSWEVGQLWMIYQASSVKIRIFKYMEAKSVDTDIKSVFTDSVNLVSLQHKTVTDIFNSVGFLLPQGFGDKDVNINAQRLFSDSLMLAYLKKINKFALIELAHGLPLTSRPDVRAFLTNTVVESQNLLNKIENIMARKGISIKPPYIPFPDSIKFVKDESYFGELLGKPRSMNVIELTHLSERIEIKEIERAIRRGFAQVAKDSDVKKIFAENVKVFEKDINRFSKFLQDENMPLPRSWTNEVTNSTEAPFSDRLMFFHSLAALTYSITANGMALSSCNRTDIISAFTKSTVSILTFGKDMLELFIKKGWYEEIPPIDGTQETINLNH
jgi:Protein of unknown function (DUF3231).